MERFETALGERWRLQIKPTIRQVMVPKASTQTLVGCAKWTVKTSMEVLGHWIDYEAGTRVSFRNFSANVTRAFFR